jgi:hypothetical protein
VEDVEAQWRRKGATLSDKTARAEFGLTQEETVQAIEDGELQFRYGSIHGHPWLRLLRREVEALVKDRHGGEHLQGRLIKTDLAQVDRELKRLKAEIATLEERRAELVAGLGRSSGVPGDQPCGADPGLHPHAR